MAQRRSHFTELRPSEVIIVVKILFIHSKTERPRASLLDLYIVKVYCLSSIGGSWYIYILTTVEYHPNDKV